MELPEPEPVKTVEGFIELDEISLKKFLDENGSEIKLIPGQTIVSAIPTYGGVEY